MTTSSHGRRPSRKALLDAFQEDDVRVSAFFVLVRVGGISMEACEEAAMLLYDEGLLR